MPEAIPFSMLGLQVSGDVGGITVYTDKLFRKIAFPKAPPDKPPTNKQIHQRQRFALACKNWTVQTAEVKENYEMASLRAYLPMTGHNLWMHVSLKNDFAFLDTLESQTGIPLMRPEYIP